MAIDTGGRTGRRPGPGSSRDAILQAAREQFTEHGFKGVMAGPLVRSSYHADKQVQGGISA